MPHAAGRTGSAAVASLVRSRCKSARVNVQRNGRAAARQRNRSRSDSASWHVSGCGRAPAWASVPASGRRPWPHDAPSRCPGSRRRAPPSSTVADLMTASTRLSKAAMPLRASRHPKRRARWISQAARYAQAPRRCYSCSMRIARPGVTGVGAWRRWRAPKDQPRDSWLGPEVRLPLHSALLQRGPQPLVDFWATWCAPYLAELPTLRELHAAYESQEPGPTGIKVEAARWFRWSRPSGRLVQSAGTAA